MRSRPFSMTGNSSIQGELHIDVPLGSRKKKIKKFAGTLYANRPVLNADEIIAWAKEYAGCETCVTPDDMHVTIAFSKEPLDWPKPMKDEQLTINVENAHVAMFGPERDCVVLTFDSEDLEDRWQFFRDQGASWSWPDYQPHITLSYHGFNRNGITPQEIPPYTGRIVLGPEEFDTLTEGWGDNVVQKAGPPDEERDKDGKWTVDKYGLDNREQRDMRGWKGGSKYNSLRKNPAFGKTLEKFPKQDGVVYRGVSLNRAEIGKLKVGSIYRIGKFSSASTSKSFAKRFAENAANKNGVLFEIDQKSARRIPRMYETHSSPGEKEVVLMTGTKFKITDVKVSSAVTHIRMKQL